MAWRPIEGGALADGASSGNLPVPTEETDDSGAAARKCHVARKLDSDLLQPTRPLGEARCVFSSEGDLGFSVLFVRPTARLTSGAARPLGPW